MREVGGIQHEAVSAFFRERVPGGDCALEFELIAGGRSNLTYRVRGAGSEWVLRRPPLGHVLPTAHDMAREFRVLSALADTDVPTPHTIALCEDPDVNGMPFYVMEYCPGVVLAESIPEGFAESHEDRQRMSQELIDVLVRLHAVDIDQVGLGDFGRPEGYLERQVRRWSQQWERSKTDELPLIDELIRRLNTALPKSPAATVVHGDYRLGNVALDPDDPGRILAIFDWEMSTLGDPLADLGYTLIYWAEPGERDTSGGLIAGAVSANPGFLSRAELVEAYSRASGRNVERVDFYQVLALYKLAVISEGIYARYLAGKTLGQGFAGMGRAAEAIAERAWRIAERSSDPRQRQG